MHVLRRIIPKYATNPVLEEALQKKEYTSLDQIRNLVTVNVVGLEEKKVNDKVTIETGRSDSYKNIQTSNDKKDTNTNECINLTQTPVDLKKPDPYSEILSLTVIKVVNNISKSIDQNLELIKSLKGIVNNNLNNIHNNKVTPNEWVEIIEGDKLIATKVIRLMDTLGIIKISDDGKKFTINKLKLDEFTEKTFDEQQFKQKVYSLNQ